MPFSQGHRELTFQQGLVFELLSPSPMVLNPKKKWEINVISQITYLFAQGDFAYLEKILSSLPCGLQCEALTLTIFL